MTELTDAINDPNASVDNILEKLKAFREERTKALADLTAARLDLAQVVTNKQSAILVSMGILE
jgi:hypothetical protein